MKINASITDFPVFSMQETFFKKFKEAGIDGLELVLGIKTRFDYARILYLSEKYNLPILSMHQPIWSGVGLYFDESFIKFAKKLGVSYIVFHPLAFCKFDSKAMEGYVKKLSSLQEKYNIYVMLENMPHDFAYRKLYSNTTERPNEEHLKNLLEIAKNYKLSLTYDTSHAEIINPEESKIFKHFFTYVKNIHVSSFKVHKHHLPLTIGSFDINDFLKFLVKEKYKGLFTLEIYYPKLQLLINKNSFKAIADSVKVIRDKVDKLK